MFVSVCHTCATFPCKCYGPLLSLVCITHGALQIMFHRFATHAQGVDVARHPAAYFVPHPFFVIRALYPWLPLHAFMSRGHWQMSTGFVQADAAEAGQGRLSARLGRPTNAYDQGLAKARLHVGHPQPLLRGRWSHAVREESYASCSCCRTATVCTLSATALFDEAAQSAVSFVVGAEFRYSDFFPIAYN